MPSAAIVKCLMQFDDGKYGWREAYYANGAATLITGSTKVNMVGMLPVFLPLIKARAKLLANGVNNTTCAGIGGYNGSCNGPVLTMVRLSQVDALRNSLLFNPLSGEIVTGTGAANVTDLTGLNATGIGSPADNPFSAIEMILSLGNGLVSKRALSGIPDATICDQAWSKSNTSWYKKWKTFAGILTNGTFGTVSSSLAANGVTSITAPGEQIQSITVNADCTLTVTPTSSAGLVQTPVGLCPPRRWQIYCYRPKKGFASINGIYRGVLSAPPSGQVTITLEYSGKCPQYLDPGFIAIYNGPTFVLFTSATLGSVMAKKRGGPFDRRRGRARVTR